MTKLLKIFLISALLSLVSCIEKQDQLVNKSLGRFTADTISLSYPQINHALNIGNTVTISPFSKSGKITACGIKYGTGGLPPGLFVDSNCNISGTPLVLAFTFTYKITAISEYNTTAEASVTITVGTFYNLGGTLSGLEIGQTATLHNGVDTIIATANGNFSFTPVGNGDTYNVTLTESDPARFTCNIINGTGTVSQNINDIQVHCVPSGLRALSGFLTGLIPSDGSITISNGGVPINLAGDGSFDFGSYNYGSAYSISVTGKPLGYNCSVSTNGAGILSDDVISVAVDCVPPGPRKIITNVKGLNIGTFTIQNNGSDNLVINSDGSFEFTDRVTFNTAYSVSILSQPPQHICSIANPSGIAVNDINDIQITCVANDYSVGGTVTGVTSGEVVKFVYNGISNASEFSYDFSSMGSSYTLPRNFEHGRQFRMYMSEVPEGKKCSFSTASSSLKIIGDTVQGFINSASISDVNIICTSRDVANCEFGHLNYMSPLGVVEDIACDGSHLYVAGSFVSQAYPIGQMSTLSSSLLSDYKQSYKVEGGGVRTAIADDDGAMYIAGEFNVVNGEPRTKLARLYSDGSLDQRFNPVIVGSIFKVIVKGNYLYVGGNFTKVNNVNRLNFAKINRFTGELQPLDISFNSTIYDMVLRDDKLAVGGIFTIVSSPASVIKACLAEIDTKTDTLTTLGISFTSVCSIVSLDKDSLGNLYAGGSFQNAGNIPSLNHLFRIKNNNLIDSVFAATGQTASHEINKVKIVNEGGVEKLMVGGNFTSIFGSASAYLSKYNLNTSTKETISNNLGYIKKISEDASYLYVVDLSGRIARYPKGNSNSDLAMMNRSIGIANNGLLENINGKLVISDLLTTNSFSYPSVGSSVSHLSRYNLNSGRIDTGYNLNFEGGSISSLIISGNDIYASGSFSKVGGVGKFRAAKIFKDTGTLDTAFSVPTSFVRPFEKMFLKNSELIVVSNVSNTVSSLNPATGALRSVIYASGTTGSLYASFVYGNDLYIGNTSQTSVKKYTIGNPSTEDVSFSLVGKSILRLSVGVSGLYLTNSSNQIEINGVSTGRYIVKIDPLTGSRDTAFLPTGSSYSELFIPASNSFVYGGIGYSFVKLSSVNGSKDSTFIRPEVTDTQATFYTNGVIEGSDFLIIGGNFNNSNNSNTNDHMNLIMIKK